nr:hypothetical protein CFP56_71111 [Quercus suber]
MPPLRTMPPAKPVKTERTHEENQERAYIAASRRSDRSLEARVESARRASEIHKKRTGRSLRVTEQDVINEEMYEEEDDDLPYPYRRLNSHLMTNDSFLDRRLHSYLVNQVAMRTMVGQAVQKAWNENSMYPQAMQGAMMNPGFPNPMAPPQSRTNSNSQYRQSPYPMAQNLHSRSASIASPQELHFSNTTAQPSPPNDRTSADRRTSLPAPTLAPRTPSSQKANSPVLSRHDSSSSLSAQQARLSRDEYGSQAQQPTFAGSAYTTDGNSTNPLTSSLPLDTQQLLAGAPLDWNDPMMQMLMQNQSGMSSPIYSYNPNGKSKSDSSKSGVGLAQTLAPASLDTNGIATASPSVDTPYTGFDMTFDNSFGNFDLFQSQPNSSGQLTPGEGEFDSFINDGMWGEVSHI